MDKPFKRGTHPIRIIRRSSTFYHFLHR